MLETLKIVGAILGIIAFFWKIVEYLLSFLHIDLEVSSEDGRTVFARTFVENRGTKSKRIDNAVLLVGPEYESPIETFQRIAECSNLGFNVNSTNDIAACHLNRPYSGPDGRVLIPLPFYYSENIAIGNESLSYKSPIETNAIKLGIPYSVRFFVWASGRYHRSTHDCFVVRAIEGD